MVITPVEQGYEFTESQQDYRTETGMTYKGRDTLIDIRKARDNFDKDRKPKCFNCNIYKHMAKKYQKLKKEQDTRKCCKYDKIKHIVKDCRTE